MFYTCMYVHVSMMAVSSSQSMADNYSFYSVILGHHIYETIWNASEGETLQLKREECNRHDRYAVSVCYISRLLLAMYPGELSRAFWYFLDHGGFIFAVKSRDIEEKGRN